MSAKKMILAGAAGLAAVVGFATPAAAQYYPAPNYGYGNNGGLGQILGQILGYGRYPYGNYGYGQYSYQNSQIAVDQCARAVEARLNGYGYNNGRYGNYGYNNGYGYNGYNNGYGYGYNNGYGYNQARVAGISRVDRKSYGYHVYGVATDRFGNGRGYVNGYGAPTLRWDCKVEVSGRIRDIDINRNMAGYRYGYGW